MELKDKKIFLITNIDLLDDYDIDPVILRTVQKKFLHDTGYHLEDSFSNFKVEAFKFEYVKNQSFDYDVLRINFEKHLQTFQLTKKELDVKYAMHTTRAWYWMRIEKAPHTIWIKEHGLSNVFYMMDYILNGNLPNDFARANKLMDDNGLNYSSTFTNQSIKGLEPLKMTVFKNGNIKLLGLSEKQYEEIANILRILEL